jgi:hypothetical protein
MERRGVGPGAAPKDFAEPLAGPFPFPGHIPLRGFMDYIQGEFDFNIIPKENADVSPAFRDDPGGGYAPPASPGLYDVIGKKITLAGSGTLSSRSYRDLYSLLEVYLNKQYETFRYLLVNKRGFIKDHVALTARNPILSPSTPESISPHFFLYQIKRRALQLDCGVVLAHNHPSGNIEASREDLRATGSLKEYFKSLFKGHIILDHGRYSVYDPGISGFQQIEKPGPPYIRDPFPDENSNSYAGIFIRGPSVEQQLRNAVQLDSGDKWNGKDWVPVFFLDGMHVTRDLHFYHLSEFSSPNADLNIIRKTVYLAKSTGSSATYVIANNDEMFEKLKIFNARTELFLDVCYNGRSQVLEDGVRGDFRTYLPVNASFDSSFPIEKENPYRRSAAAHDAGKMPPEQTGRAGIRKAGGQPPGNALPPHKPYGIKIRASDAARWAEQQFPDACKRYGLLKFRLNSGRPGNRDQDRVRRDLGILKSEFAGYYKIFSLGRFDQAEYEHNIEKIMAAKSIDDFPGKFVNIGFLPQIYKDIGYVSTPLFITSRHLYLIANENGFIKGRNAHYHNIQTDVIRAIPELIKEPKLIFNLKREDFSTLALLDAFDKENRPIALYSKPVSKIFNSSNTINFNASLALSFYGINDSKQRNIMENIENSALYIKKEAAGVSPVPRPRQERRIIGAIENTGLPPAHSLEAGFLEKNIANYKKPVNKYLDKNGDNTRFLARDKKPPYGGPYTSLLKEHAMSEIAPAPRPDPGRPRRRMAIEYLETLLCIEDPEKRREYHDRFTQIPLFRWLRGKPEWNSLENQYRNMLESYKADFPDAPGPAAGAFAGLSPLSITSGGETPPGLITAAGSLNSPEGYAAYYRGHYSPAGRNGFPPQGPILRNLGFRQYGMAPDPKALFSNFAGNPFGPETPVPPFGVFREGSVSLKEGYSFLKRDNTGDTVTLWKTGADGQRETVRLTKNRYNSIIEASKAPAGSPELTPDIVRKYEETVGADINKAGGNTAAGFWHDYRVPARERADTPAVATPEIAPEPRPDPGQPKRRMAIEYLETLLRIEDPEKRREYHESFTQISLFKWLRGEPEWNSLENQYRNMLESYKADFPDAPGPAAGAPAGLSPLSVPSGGETPLGFLKAAGSLNSPEEYAAYYRKHFAFGEMNIKPVSPRKIAIFDTAHSLPLAVYDNNPKSRAGLYSLANHNGFSPQGLIPRPEDVARQGIGILGRARNRLEELLSESYHGRCFRQYSAAPDPKAPFSNFARNPFSPGTAVPPFGVFREGSVSLKEGYSFLKSDDTGDTVTLWKTGAGGQRETVRLTKIHYNSIIEASKAPAGSPALTPDIVRKYEETVGADINKVRKNTAANFWHNYRVLARERADNPVVAMKIAKDILDGMNPAEHAKFRASMSLYEKGKNESYNDRILNYYRDVVKDIPIKNRTVYSGDSLPIFRYNDDSVNVKGKPVDSRLRIRIGDEVKLALGIPDLLSGRPAKRVESHLVLEASSANNNKIVLVDKDGLSKYILNRDDFIKRMEKVEKLREREERASERKQRRKNIRESVSFGY